MSDHWHRQARKVMSEHLGRPLGYLECVHHIDENPRNNDLSNLKIMTREDHASLHTAGKRRTRPNKKSKKFIIRDIRKIMRGAKKLAKSSVNKDQNPKVRLISEVKR